MYMQLTILYYRSGGTFIYSTDHRKNPQRSMLQESLRHSLVTRIRLSIVRVNDTIALTNFVHIHIANP